jgi:hypothetical protein
MAQRAFASSGALGSQETRSSTPFDQAQVCTSDRHANPHARFKHMRRLTASRAMAVRPTRWPRDVHPSDRPRVLRVPLLSAERGSCARWPRHFGPARWIPLRRTGALHVRPLTLRHTKRGRRFSPSILYSIALQVEMGCAHGYGSVRDATWGEVVFGEFLDGLVRRMAATHRRRLHPFPRR